MMTPKRLRTTLPLPAVFLILAVAAAPAAAEKLVPPPNAVASASGLVTERLTTGTGDAPPDANDHVAIHFTLYDASGAVFDESASKGKPATFSMQQSQPAFREALDDMVTGEKRRLWIPAGLAPPNAPRQADGKVIFDIELVAVLRMPDPPSDVGRPPADAERSLYGAFSKVLREGSGKKGEEGPGSLANYALWTTDGQLVDTTAARQRPTLFLYDKVMAAFADVLKGMREGEKRRIWIPGEIAAGQWKGNPKGMLTFEVELVRVMPDTLLDTEEAQGGFSPANPGGD